MNERADELDRDFRTFCRSNDLAALGRAFDASAPQLLRLALWLCGNRADADDVVQRTFLQAIDTRARFDVSRSAMPWLIGLLTNQVRKVRRERRQATATTPVDPSPDPVVAAATRELESALAAVVAQLGPAYQDVLRLHLQEGHDARQISARLHRPAGTVRTQLVRGLQALRAKLPAGFRAGLAPAWWQSEELPIADDLRMRVLAHATHRVTKAIGPQLLLGVAGVCILVLATVLGLVGMGQPTASHVTKANHQQALATANHAMPARTGDALLPPPALVRSEVPAATGMLLVEVAWADDGSAASGQPICCYSSHHPLRVQHLGSDGDGHCRFEGIEPGMVTVLGGQTPITVAIVAGETRVCAVRRTRGIRLRGQVIDATGRGLADATVMSQPDSVSYTPVVIARCGPGGTFEAFVAPGTNVHARHPEFAPSPTRLIEGTAGEPQTIQLSVAGIGGNLFGQVLDATGTPVPWAQVSAVPQRTDAPASSGRLGQELPALCVRADASGNYRIVGLPAGPNLVRAWGIGCAPWSGDVLVAPRGELRFDPRLTPGATIAGTLRDAAGAPASAGIDVEQPWDRSGTIGDASDAHGVFLIDSLAPGSRKVVASSGPRGRAQTTLMLRSGETTRWNPLLDRGRVVHGTVVDLHGFGIAKATVGWQFRGRERTAWVQSATDGTFELPNLPSDPIDVVVYGNAWTTIAEERDVRAPVSDLVLRVVTPANACLRGRVVDARGTPLRANVVIGLGGIATRRDGTFELNALVAGTYDIAVGIEGQPWLPWRSVELRPAEEMDLGDFVLHAPVALVVRCTSGDGKPLPSGSVVIAPEGSSASGGQAAVVDGVAHVTGLQPRRYRVVAHGNRLRGEATIDIAAGRDQEVAVHLEPYVLCKVQCTSPHPLPAGSKALVEAIDSGGRNHRGTASIDDGPYGGDNLSLPLGTHTLRARVADSLVGEITVEVAEPWFGEKALMVRIPLRAASGR